jgi:hypothetical protein
MPTFRRPPEEIGPPFLTFLWGCYTPHPSSHGPEQNIIQFWYAVYCMYSILFVNNINMIEYPQNFRISLGKRNQVERKRSMRSGFTTHFTDMCIPHFFLASERRTPFGSEKKMPNAHISEKRSKFYCDAQFLYLRMQIYCYRARTGSL